MYNDRVMQIEQGTFTPLVFTTTCSMGPGCLQYHQSLAENFPTRQAIKYSDVMCFIRCTLSFMCVRSSFLCLRGSRSSKTPTESGNDLGLYNLELNLDG